MLKCWSGAGVGVAMAACSLMDAGLWVDGAHERPWF